MKAIKLFLLLSASLSFFNLLSAQDKMSIRFGKVTARDFDVKPPSTDAAANAVVVADWGNSEFVANANDHTMSIVFTKKTRIKIINKDGFDAASINVYLYSVDSAAENFEELKACTYNLENGKIVKTKVDNSSLLTESKNKNWVIKKFSFPAVKEGSIIEYSYTIKSNFLFNLQPWSFQSRYPCLWSEYNAGIPEFFKYEITSQGHQSLFINKTTQSHVQYNFRVPMGAAYGYATGLAADRAFGSTATDQIFNLNGMRDNHRWVMINMPPIKASQDTTSNKDISKVEFKLIQISYRK